MEAIAKLKNCPLSPRKMRLVADQVRGLKVDKALNILQFNQKRTYSVQIEGLLLSAIANWGQKNSESGSDESDLYVKTIFVDGGRSLKRLRTAPQGRAHRIRKRSNHITLIVDEINKKESADLEAETVTEEKN
jgi:large subunit ribosomal protein L22